MEGFQNLIREKAQSALQRILDARAAKSEWIGGVEHSSDAADLLLAIMLGFQNCDSSAEIQFRDISKFIKWIRDSYVESIWLGSYRVMNPKDDLDSVGVDEGIVRQYLRLIGLGIDITKLGLGPDPLSILHRMMQVESLKFGREQLKSLRANEGKDSAATGNIQRVFTVMGVDLDCDFYPTVEELDLSSAALKYLRERIYVETLRAAELEHLAGHFSQELDDWVFLEFLRNAWPEIATRYRSKLPRLTTEMATRIAKDGAKRAVTEARKVRTMSGAALADEGLDFVLGRLVQGLMITGSPEGIGLAASDFECHSGNLLGQIVLKSLKYWGRMRKKDPEDCLPNDFVSTFVGVLKTLKVPESDWGLNRSSLEVALADYKKRF